MTRCEIALVCFLMMMIMEVPRAFAEPYKVLDKVGRAKTTVNSLYNGTLAASRRPIGRFG